MRVPYKVETFILIVLFLTSCREQQPAKDIAALLPDRIEIKFGEIKNVRFIPDSNKKEKPVTLSEFNLPDSTTIYLSKLDSGNIYMPSPPDTSTVLPIPCCSINHFYEDVPWEVTYSLCFKPPLSGTNTNTTARMKKVNIEVKNNGELSRLVCSTTTIIVDAKVVCVVCGNSSSCILTFTLFGHTYSVAPVPRPSAAYHVSSSRANVPCGNCPHSPCN